MRPSSTSTPQEIKIDPVEIADAKWVPVEEYLASTDGFGFTRSLVSVATDKSLSGMRVDTKAQMMDSWEVFIPDSRL